MLNFCYWNITLVFNSLKVYFSCQCSGRLLVLVLKFKACTVKTRYWSRSWENFQIKTSTGLSLDKKSVVSELWIFSCYNWLWQFHSILPWVGGQSFHRCISHLFHLLFWIVAHFLEYYLVWMFVWVLMMEIMNKRRKKKVTKAIDKIQSFQSKPEGRGKRTN